MPETTLDEYGRPEMPLAGTEAQTLTGFLDYQRATLAWKCRGLDDDQLRTTLHPTAITLAGLLKHLARVEDYWFGCVIAEQPRLEPWASMPWAAEWDNHVEHTGDELRALWSGRVEAAHQVVVTAMSATDDPLGTTHPAWGGDTAQVSLRWVLTHMIEEYARHNGHADLLREAIDGETGE
jgi:uncharacterized damage-inducible protein DinB